MLEFPESGAKVETNFVGRVEIFDEIKKWLADTNQRYFLLTGEPGIGKSAFASRLIQDPRFAVRAYHFCVAGSGGTVNPGVAIQSISSQLRQTLPGFEQEYVASATERRITLSVNLAVGQMLGGEAVAAKIGVVNAINYQDEFESALRAPLSKLQGVPDPVIIVIDGLDEALSFQGPVNLVTLVANANDVPLWVRFFCTSRPDSRVLRFFSSLETRLLTAESQSNLNDLRQYIDERFRGMADLIERDNHSTDKVAAKIANVANGSFLVATLLLDDIEAGRLSEHDLVASPSGIDEIYRRFLSRVDYSAWSEQYQPLCEILVAAQEPLTESMMSEVLGITDTKLRNTLAVFQQFLRRSAEAVPRRYRLFHQSLRDYLSSQERAGSFFCSDVSGHKSISDYYLSKWRVDPKSIDAYGFTYLPLHLALSQRVSRLKPLLTSFDWLRIKLRTDGLRPLLQDFVLPGNDPDLSLIRFALMQSSKVLWKRPAELGAQLAARLSVSNSAAIRDLKQEILTKYDSPWLRLLSPTMVQASEPLLSTATIEDTGFNAPPLIAITPDCARLVMASPQAPLRMLDLESGEVLLSSQNPEKDDPFLLKVGRSGDYAITASAARFYRGRYGNFSVTVWSLLDGTAQRLPDDGDLVAVDENAEFAAISSGSKCRIWDLKKIRCTREIPLRDVTIEALGPNAETLVVSAGQGKIAIIDVPDGSSRTFSVSVPIDGCFITADLHNLLLTGKNGVETRDLLTTKVRSFNEWKPGHNAISPEGLVLVTASDGHIRTYDMTSGEETNDINTHVPPLQRLVVSAGARRVVGATKTEIRAWDLARTENRKQLSFGPLARLDPYRTGYSGCLSMTPDGVHAAAVLHDGSICVISVQQRVVRQIPSTSSPTTCVHIPAEGGAMISGCKDGTILVWDLSTLRALETLSGTGNSWNFIFLSRATNRVYAVRYGLFQTWKLAEARTPSRLTLNTPSVQDPAFFAAFSPNGSKAITAIYSGVTLWDLELNREIGHWDSQLVNAMACTDEIGAISDKPSGRPGPEGQCVKIWDLKTLEHVFSVDTAASCLALSPDGSYLMIGGEGLTVFDIATRKAVATFTPDAEIAGCAMSQDNTAIVALDSTSQLHFFELIDQTR